MNINAKLPEKPHTSRRIMVTVGIERIEIRSLRSAVELLRSLRADICGEQAARLVRANGRGALAGGCRCRVAGLLPLGGACAHLTGGDDGHHPVKRAA